MIVKAVGGVLYTPLRYVVEKGKDSPIDIIIQDPEYVKKFGRSFKRPARQGVYDDKLDGNKVTIAVRKTEAVCTQDQDPKLGLVVRYG